MKNKDKIVVIRTGFMAYTWSSLWGILLTMIPFYLNYKFVGGNNFIDLMLFVIAISCAFNFVNKDGKNIKRFKTINDLHDWVNGELK